MPKSGKFGSGLFLDCVDRNYHEIVDVGIDDGHEMRLPAWSNRAENAMVMFGK